RGNSARGSLAEQFVREPAQESADRSAIRPPPRLAQDPGFARRGQVLRARLALLQLLDFTPPRFDQAALFGKRQGALEFAVIEPDSVRLADVEDDPGDRAEVLAVHEIPA